MHQSHYLNRITDDLSKSLMCFVAAITIFWTIFPHQSAPLCLELLFDCRSSSHPSMSVHMFEKDRLCRIPCSLIKSWKSVGSSTLIFWWLIATEFRSGYSITDSFDDWHLPDDRKSLRLSASSIQSWYST